MKSLKGRSLARLTFAGVLAAGVVSLVVVARAEHASKAGDKKAPVFEVDRSWPKIPANMLMGEVSSVAVDAQDHIWVLHRYRTLRPAQKALTAPPVLEFDSAGNYMKGWGGPGDGYEWPATEHGIFVDHKGYVWISGSAKVDAQVIKFTQDGKFVMQIGHSGQSKGNKDTANLSQPADLFVYPKSNELFVADGYGNRRVIVLDADSGAFKRMWGAFGKEATDPAPEEAKMAHEPPANDPSDGPGPEQFVLPHSARVSDDGLVYVADKGGRRVQVFALDGKYQKQVFIGRGCKAPDCGNGATAASTAFSPDPQQRYLYVADRSEGHVVVVDRKSLEILYSFGKRGMEPGDFNVIHEIATDMKGNLYTTEVNDNFGAGECCRRIQKFVYKGMSSSFPTAE